MFPFFRMAIVLVKNLRLPKLDIDGTHVSHHRCWPVDLDMWRELNNGRTLTLYDFGRISIAQRTPLGSALRRNGWKMTMAGVTARYRRRVVMFDKFEMRSRIIGHDGRFLLVQQGMWKKGEALSSVLYRVAVVGDNGIIPSAQVVAAMGAEGWCPDLPEWVQKWTDAESARAWPPEV